MRLYMTLSVQPSKFESAPMTYRIRPAIKKDLCKKTATAPFHHIHNLLFATVVESCKYHIISYTMADTFLFTSESVNEGHPGASAASSLPKCIDANIVVSSS